MKKVGMMEKKKNGKMELWNNGTLGETGKINGRTSFGLRLNVPYPLFRYSNLPSFQFCIRTDF